MENKQIWEIRYKNSMDSAKMYVGQNNLAEAKTYFKHALEAAIELMKCSFGTEYTRYRTEAQSIAGYLETINQKLAAATVKPADGGAAAPKNEETAKQKPAAKKVSVEEALGRLNDLTGLTAVKKQVSQMVSIIKNDAIRKSRGMGRLTRSYHMVFTGNPGTGKTTVARIMADIFCSLGLLNGGQLVETDRSGLVAEYVGQTAQKTKAKIEQAMDGVLFIDEAYELARGGANDFGSEAITTLLKEMEDNRDRMVVIVAGYKDDMKRFISSNEGLVSRFSNYIQFDDYTGEEMFKIFRSMCQKQQYILDGAAQQVVQSEFNKMYGTREKGFANARTVRQVFERSTARQAQRLEPLGMSVSDADLRMIKAEDLDFTIPKINN